MPPARQRHRLHRDVRLSGFRAHHRGMTEMTVSNTRARLADVVDAAQVVHDPIY